MSEENVKDPSFNIKLNGFTLTRAQYEAIVMQLQSATVAEIAKLDFRKSFDVRLLGGPGEFEGIEVNAPRVK